jgi:catechol 2,3-dioxygenase-like lactoylglutathione lyase family enzyme
MTMAIGKIDHIDFTTTNVEEMEKFFVEKLGFKLLRRIVHADKSVDAELTTPAGDFVIQLRPADEKKLQEKRKQASEGTLFFNHLAFKADDINKEHNELKSKGVAFKDAAPKFNKESGRMLTTAADPIGRYWIQLSDQEK